MKTLNIKHYELSLANLNFNFEPLAEPALMLPYPQAFIKELPDTYSQLTTKWLLDKSWLMAQKLSQVLAKSVLRTKTHTVINRSMAHQICNLSFLYVYLSVPHKISHEA